MLTALALVTAGLLALGPLSFLLPRRSHALIPWGTAALCGTGLAVSLAGLVARFEGTLALPIGLPGADGGGMRLALDGLTGFALPPMFLCGAASAACAPGGQARGAALLPPFVGCMALALLAADGFTLLLGFEGMLVATWGLVLAQANPGEANPGGARAAARLPLGVALLGGACLVPAVGLLGARTGGFDPAFAAVRAAPPGGWQAAAVLGLTVLGAGSRMGLAPWLTRLAPGHAGALLSGAAPGVAAYVLARVVFDLCGPATPPWWGVPLLGLGAVCAVLGALRANVEPDLAGVLAAGAAGSVGLVAMGFGVALAARGTDLPPLAASALGGALLHLLAHGASTTLLLLCAGAVERAAGSRELSRLGGLIHRMPATSLCALVGATSFALLPPGAGFAGAWVVVQSLLAAPRAGGPAWQIAAAVAVAAAGMSAALAASAAVRLVGLVFLGRPRTPRAASAEEAPRHVRLVLAALAGLTVSLGLLPGAALRLAAPALHLLVGAEPAGVGVMAVAPGADAPGYSAPGLAAVLAAVGLAVAWVVRARMVRGERRGPAWDGGLGAPSAWSPADDPAAWYGGTSMVQPLARAFGPLPGTRDGVGAPLPGQARPARHRSLPHDRRLRRSIESRKGARVVPRRAQRSRWLVRAADRAHRLTPGQSLAATVSTLALLLALTAWAGGR